MFKIELGHPQKWLRFLDKLSNVWAAVQSDELVIALKPSAGPEVHKQAEVLQALINALCPEIVHEAGEIAVFLKDNEQTIMAHAWEDFREQAGFDLDSFVSSYSDVAHAVSNFWNSIGEAMGPICYAGWQLKNTLKKHNAPSDWVDDCIKYYEDNWRF